MSTLEEPRARISNEQIVGELDVSIVIATKDRPDDLHACILSICQQTRFPNEVIVVDASQGINAQRNRAALNMLQATPISTLYLPSDLRSLTYQRNTGVDHAKGDIIFFLDDDVELFPRLFETMFDVYLELGRDIDGLQGVSTDFVQPTWTNQLGDAIFLPGSTFSKYQQGIHPSGFSFIKRGAKARVQPVQWMAGYCMSYRREVFERYRFDTELGGYALSEDKDFSFRVSQDFQLYRLMNAGLKHKKSFAGRLDEEALMRMWVINRHMLFAKNFENGLITRILFQWALLGRISVLLLYGLLRRDLQAVRGVLKGLKDIFTRS
ncbi:MAG: glycosyltransferase family 2 protein [Candidatus Promineifilaceae bacterium]